jgi:hypothetical protein
MFGGVEGESEERLAIGLERYRPLVNGRVESLYDKHSVFAVGMIGKPFELLATPT